jgi:hypothetical protein
MRAQVVGGLGRLVVPHRYVRAHCVEACRQLARILELSRSVEWQDFDVFGDQSPGIAFAGRRCAGKQLAIQAAGLFMPQVEFGEI